MARLKPLKLAIIGAADQASKNVLRFSRRIERRRTVVHEKCGHLHADDPGPCGWPRRQVRTPKAALRHV